MSNLTVKKLLQIWLAERLQQESTVHVAYHQMPDVVKWAQRNYNVTHAPNTFERKLREIINEDYPHRFTDVSKAMGKRHKVWLLSPQKESTKQPKSQDKMTHKKHFIKTHKDKYLKAENNADLRILVAAHKDGDLEDYSEFRDRNGWYCINGGIYLREFTEEKSGATKMQLAHDIAGYQNKYLRKHSEKILRKIAMETWPNAQIGIWGKADGGTLNIMGRGPSSNMNYLEWIV